MKKTLIFALGLTSLLLLVGCGNKKTTSDIKATGLEACDSYVQYLTCVADHLGDGGIATKKALAQTVASWENYSTDELLPICEAALEGLEKYKDLYKDYDCDITTKEKTDKIDDAVDTIEQETGTSTMTGS